MIDAGRVKVLLQSASEAAADLAVAASMRSMHPYRYCPSISTVPVNPHQSLMRVRSCLLELLQCDGGIVGSFFYDLSPNSSAAVGQLLGDGSTTISNLCSMSIEFYPEQLTARFVGLANFIRGGDLQAADEVAMSILARSPSPSSVSRALANIAVMHELSGDLVGARRIARRSVEQSQVSPLAASNYYLYCVAA